MIWADPITTSLVQRSDRTSATTPGVGSDFGWMKGTGGGTSARLFQNMSFPEVTQ